MKKSYIIGLLVISVALGFSLWAFSSSLSPYVDLKTARKTAGPVQVRGLVLKDADHLPYYDAQSHAFRFWMEDSGKEHIEVVYHGAKPDSFDEAPGVSASGVIARDPATGREYFNSDSLSVKCPSKYDDRKPDYSKKPNSTGGPI